MLIITAEAYRAWIEKILWEDWGCEQVEWLNPTKPVVFTGFELFQEGDKLQIGCEGKIVDLMNFTPSGKLGGDPARLLDEEEQTQLKGVRGSIGYVAKIRCDCIYNHKVKS